MDELESIKSAATSSSARRHPEDLDSDDNNDSESAHLNHGHGSRDEDGDDNDEDEDDFDLFRAGPGTNMPNFKNTSRLSGSFQTVRSLLCTGSWGWDSPTYTPPLPCGPFSSSSSFITRYRGVL